MKAVIALVVAAGVGSVVATLSVGSRLFEEKVTPDPYQAGLRWDEEQRRALRAGCDISRGPCRARAEGGGELALEIAPRPVRAMADLAFAVSAPEGPHHAGTRGEIALTMPGMYMGENRVRLEPGADGRLLGRGVIVHCPSGGRTWSAEVTARQPGGAPRRAVFTFDLAD